MEYIELINKAELMLKNKFKEVDNIALYNFSKIMKAFQNNKVSLRHFSGTTGYGYDDIARDVLSKIYAEVFNAEDAIVSPLITSGTHAITLCLFGLLKSGDCLLSITGNPYDTLSNVISGDGIGSLKDYNILFDKIFLKKDDFDYSKIAKKIQQKAYNVIFIGRSRGYEVRNALSIESISKVIKLIKELSPNSIILVDNCYGEFVKKIEPTDVGADVAVGSLIKNPGGGLAPTGGYIVGKAKLIEKIAYRMTAPGLGFEVGSYENSYRMFYQGLFLSPTTVKNAVKGNLLFGKVFEILNYKTTPSTKYLPNDIIRSIEFNDENSLITFCRTIQKVSPVDSHVVPYPWDMPGYSSQVIMAAGAFVQGASIELSCDSPIKKPYLAYIQGGLTYEHMKFALLNVLKDLNVKI